LPAAVGYRALILSLTSLYKEELHLIRAVKRRFPHLEIWLTHTDGRQAALAEAMRLGADGLLAEDGLHRIAPPPEEQTSRSGMEFGSPLSLNDETMLAQPSEQSVDVDSDVPNGEPVLTADELRALLQEQPLTPPSGGPD